MHKMLVETTCKADVGQCVAFLIFLEFRGCSRYGRPQVLPAHAQAPARPRLSPEDEGPRHQRLALDSPYALAPRHPRREAQAQQAQGTAERTRHRGALSERAGLDRFTSRFVSPFQLCHVVFDSVLPLHLQILPPEYLRASRGKVARVGTGLSPSCPRHHRLGIAGHASRALQVSLLPRSLRQRSPLFLLLPAPSPPLRRRRRAVHSG